MKRILSLFITLLLLIACNKKDHGDTNLHITGTVKGLKQGKLYIQHVRDTALVTMDSIIINGNSSFESHLKLDSPEMLYLFLDRGQTNSVDNSLPFFAEPGEMTIETTNDEFFAKATITGSENQKMYEEFLKMKKRFTNDNLDLIEQNVKATQENNTVQLDSISQKMDQTTKRRYLFTVNYALNHAKYDLGPYLALSEIYDANVIYLDTIQKSMTPEVAKSYYGKMLTKYVKGIKAEEANSVK
ncbi:DUF4369 domain-containing protein [Flavobacterium arcticum]|uniref:DUF4369 domain-containing protein n=1 Tax=Flavobacterium arcticum TaxID=1784713 RepID=A0A345H961_9FLAO|nr:DUF4369 domain-containing protein [Flavobacterium arcticum]AXG73121.1 DUF4369 domain-containing protein [Flavobacterium arcticum]KAF2512912.1 DUF4369 domain-containing protein [Flavobacterium arcticum]